MLRSLHESKSCSQQLSVLVAIRVLVFGLSGVMISIKSIDRHIGHGSSVGVCFLRICFAKITRQGRPSRRFNFVRSPLGGGSVAILF